MRTTDLFTIDGKPVLMDSGLEETEDGNLGFLNEIGQ